jgi:hypothetical protein
MGKPAQSKRGLWPFLLSFSHSLTLYILPSDPADLDGVGFGVLVANGPCAEIIVSREKWESDLLNSITPETYNVQANSPLFAYTRKVGGATTAGCWVRQVGVPSGTYRPTAASEPNDFDIVVRLVFLALGRAAAFKLRSNYQR